MSNPQQLFTNSCIQLSIPPQYQQLGPISYIWTSYLVANGSNNFGPFFHQNNQKMLENVQQSYYICSPFDLACVVHVQVYQSNGGQKIFLQELKYGPVRIEENLLSTIYPGQWKHIEILLNKNIRKSAGILVTTFSNSGQRSKSIKLIIKANNFQFDLVLSQEIAKAQIQNLVNQPFFKIFDTEPNALGLYINHKMTEFMQKLKQLKIYYHFGHYLKIYFNNRSCRDIFIFHLLSLADFRTQQIQIFKKQFQQHQYPLKQNDQKQGHPQQKQKQQTPKVPKIQSTIKNSQINGAQLLNISEAQSQFPKVKQDILEDIYNILYAPVAKIQRQSLHPENQQQSQPIQTKSKTNQEVISGFTESTRNQNNSQKNLHEPVGMRENNAASKQLSLQDKIMFQKTMQSFSSPKDNIAFKPVPKLEPQKNEYEEKQKKIIKKEPKQIQYLQKIYQLTKVNDELVLQNRRLKAQNQRYRQNELKKQKNTDVDKMLQIKKMVELMAKKLQMLEQGQNKNKVIIPLASPRRNIPKFYPSGQQSVRRFWSQKQHEQMIKNLKQKNLEMKQNSLQKQKQFRKKSSQHTESPQVYPPSNETKANPRFLRECLSAGKKDMEERRREWEREREKGGQLRPPYQIVSNYNQHIIKREGKERDSKVGSNEKYSRTGHSYELLPGLVQVQSVPNLAHIQSPYYRSFGKN